MSRTSNAVIVENFLRRTTGNQLFWDRLTGQFLIEMKTKISDIMDEFKDYLPDLNTVEDVAETIFEKLTSIMNMIADGDEDSIRRIFNDIRGSKWDETVTSYIEIIANKLTRFFIFLFHKNQTYISISLPSCLGVTCPTWPLTSRPTMISRPPSPTTTSSSRSKPFCSRTGLKMKSIQPALRILSEGSTTLDCPYSMQSTEYVPATTSQSMFSAGF